MRNRLKVLRAERDWTQEELARRLGVSRQAVNAIETGKYDPSLPLALKVGRLFEKPVEEISSSICRSRRSGLLPALQGAFEFVEP